MTSPTPHDQRGHAASRRTRRPLGRPGAALTLALSVGALALASCGKDSEERIAEPTPLLVETLTIETGTRGVSRRYTGNLHPWEVHPLGFLTGGRIRELRPSVGDEVEKGDLIATLVPDEHAIHADLAAIQRDALEPHLQRIRQLVDQNILPRAQLDEIEARYEAALTRHRQANLSLSHTRLRAPVRGVVMERMASEGQVIGPGMPAVVLLEVDRLRARFGIPQRDLVYFDRGDEVFVRIPGVEGQRTGTIERIDLVPDTKTRTYGLSVTLDNSDRSLRVGMISHLEIEVSRAEGVFVPMTSVSRARSGDRQIKVLDDSGERVVVRDVQIGARIGEELEVLSGLAAGDRVIVRGQSFVRDGERVLTR